MLDTYTLSRGWFESPGIPLHYSALCNALYALTAAGVEKKRCPRNGWMMSTLRFYSRLTRLIGVLAYGVALAVIACVIERFVRDRLGLRQKMSQHFMKVLVRALPFRVSVQGPRPTRPMLWIANHVSWTDIPLLGQLAPVSFLSKAEVRNWPLAGWLAQHGGTLFIRRGAGESQTLTQQIGTYLEHEHALVLFPEGTTGDGTHVMPFHGRLLTAAVERELPIQPIAIAYRRLGEPCSLTPFIGDEELPRHLFRLLRADACDVVVTFLPLIDTHGVGRSELARKARADIAQTLQVEAAPAARSAA
jgi:1-acyl-sn-glycerol-3-phosphate acyltransferase